MLGYLTVGILIGPHAFGWVPDSEQTRYLAEFGVVFLMFSIGLEFSLPRLKSMRRIVFGLGLAQVVATIVGAFLLGLLLGPYVGVGPAGAFALASALAMSSTAITMKLLAERLELETEHGKHVLGVVLFQDLAVVPLLVVVPTLAQEAGALAPALAWAALKAVVLLGVLLVGGQWLLRRWLYLVAKRRSRGL